MSIKKTDDDLYSDSDDDSDNEVSSEQEDENEEEENLVENEEDDENEEDVGKKDDDEEDVEAGEEEQEDEDDEVVEGDHGYIPTIGGGKEGMVEDEDDDDDDDDESNNLYLQKFNSGINKNYIVDYHPESCLNNYEEISVLTRVVRDKNNNIIDDLHKTIPFLTKYERTRILGQRAKQINSGAKAFVKVPENVIDGYLIAELELAQKRIPFIIRRPTPGGGCEYWNVRDLEIVSM
jgi:DNA-directed RNA polymerase subunit K/omega